MGGGMLVQQMVGVVYIGYWLVLRMTIWGLKLVEATGGEWAERQVFWVGR